MSGTSSTQLMLAVILLCVSVVATSTSAFLWSWRQRNPQMPQTQQCLDLVVDVPSDARCAPPYHLEQAGNGVFTCGCVRILPRTKSQ